MDYPYILLAGSDADDLKPIASFSSLDVAVKAGEHASNSGFSYVAVTFMSEDETSEIEWSNYERT